MNPKSAKVDHRPAEGATRSSDEVERLIEHRSAALPARLDRNRASTTTRRGLAATVIRGLNGPVNGRSIARSRPAGD